MDIGKIADVARMADIFISLDKAENNSEFWKNKLLANKERDEKEKKEIEELGWKVIIVWECQLKKAERERTLDWLVEKIREA